MDVIVSVIIPNYNKGNYINQTLHSLLCQSFRNWEAIIIDDNSSDNSVEIINKYLESDSRFKALILDKSYGASYCRNKGIEASVGKYIVFLDSDDLLAEKSLEDRVSSMKDSKFDFCVFPMATFISRINDNTHVWHPSKYNALNRFLMHDLPWAICQPIWKKDFLIKLNGFDEQFTRLQDVEFHIRALQMNPEFCVYENSDPDCYYRIDQSRIYDAVQFVDNWIKSAVQFYRKFKHINEKYVSLTILNTLINAEVYNLKYRFSADKLSYFRKELICILDSGKNRFILKSIIVIFSLFRVYPKGIKKITSSLMKL